MLLQNFLMLFFNDFDFKAWFYFLSTSSRFDTRLEVLVLSLLEPCKEIFRKKESMRNKSKWNWIVFVCVENKQGTKSERTRIKQYQKTIYSICLENFYCAFRCYVCRTMYI